MGLDGERIAVAGCPPDVTPIPEGGMRQTPIRMSHLVFIYVDSAEGGTLENPEPLLKAKEFRKDFELLTHSEKTLSCLRFFLTPILREAMGIELHILWQGEINCLYFASPYRDFTSPVMEKRIEPETRVIE